MLIVRDPELLRKEIRTYKTKNLKIGFVPTMGALHAGHLSLINESKANSDKVVCSIFVNPTQFNSQEDLDTYPRQEAEDLALLEKVKCDLVFLPSSQDMYKNPGEVKFSFGELERKMEGEHRPGHFNGVATIVAKLFHMVNPDIAFFGQKDIQQFVILNTMVNALSFPVEMVRCAIIRDENGLALSSRNRRLSEKGRLQASKIAKTLNRTPHLAESDKSETIERKLTEILKEEKELTAEYIQIVHLNDLSPVSEFKKGIEYVVCAAVYVEGVRLIDNLVFTL